MSGHAARVRRVSGVPRLIRAAVARRRLQSLVIGAVALLSTTTVVLAVGLLAASNAPFDHAFARQSGAHATASFDPSLSTVDQLTATGRASGVTAAAGPYDAVSARTVTAPYQLGAFTVVGRADPGGAVDRLSVQSGRWLSGPGEVVLSQDKSGPPGTGVGDTLSIGGVNLRVVGVATSITRTADAWVSPAQRDVLHAAGATTSRQMLYRFAAAGDDAAVAASLARATAGLPGKALLGSASYLAAKRDADSGTGPTVPFVVAFAILGLVMAVLIVANVVNGAVVAGYRNIGVLKSVGLGPGQVVAVYAGQILVPGLVGSGAGAVLGYLLALPLLGRADRAYAVPSAGLAGWVDPLAVLGMAAVLAMAAIVPAVRAGRFPAARAISVGRAPRTGHGYRLRRVLAASRLPLPVGYGLGTPFARPARTAVTLVAVLLGAATVVLGVGLAGSLARVTAAGSRVGEVPVVAETGVFDVKPGKASGPPDPGEAPDPATVLAAIRAQAGTARVVGLTEPEVTLVGHSQPVRVEAYDGDATWVGYRLVSGRWYAGPGEVVLGSGLLRTTGHKVGDVVTLATDSGRRQVTVVGEAFDLQDDGQQVLAGTGTLTGLTDTTVRRFEIGLNPGTDAQAYAAALSAKLGTGAMVSTQDSSSTTITIMLSLIVILTLLLSAVAALGVFNTVVLNTRERVHEIGVLKTLGMTPRQVRAMVVASMAGVGLVAGALAVPVGVLVHHRVLPIMADAAGTGIPASFLAVYSPVALVGLALGGMVLAVLGALVPAGWAARTRTATALRAE